MDTLLHPAARQFPGPQQEAAVRTLRLAAGAVCAFDGATTLLVRCVSGSVWVTQEGNPGDVILSSGERFIPARSGKIVVQSLGGATATVSALECMR